MAKAWQGRFAGQTHSLVERFTESITVDRRLYRQDIRASIAHAQMLADCGLITHEEAAGITEVLTAIAVEIDEGKFPFDVALEDIHLHIESELIKRLGDVGRKLHTARSRNDQIATDLKLWVRDHLDLLDAALLEAQRSLVRCADRNGDLVLPGYTHLQRAQPVLATHYCLAYVEKLERDRDRVADCRKRTNVLPLGSAALAGTTLPIDRHRTAELLGFDLVAANSLDVSSDRDFVLETGFVLTLIAEHLSGWAEEWILWSTTEFGFVSLPDEVCTGSSIMPQKKNPDVLELIRGKTARVIGCLQTLLVLVKGLPLAYNRDLQEDKPPLFDAMDTVLSSLELATLIIDHVEFNRPVIAGRLEEGFLDATTLMESLIRGGLPMRSAHEAVGRLVRAAVERGCRLADLPHETFADVGVENADALKQSLGVNNTIQAFQSFGSTGPQEVARQLAAWKTRLEIP